MEELFFKVLSEGGIGIAAIGLLYVVLTRMLPGIVDRVSASVQLIEQQHVKTMATLIGHWERERNIDRELHTAQTSAIVDQLGMQYRQMEKLTEAVEIHLKDYARESAYLAGRKQGQDS